MPFDAMSATTVSVLDRLGLTPVPDAVLQAHKQKVEADFRAAILVMDVDSRPTHWRSMLQRAQWCEVIPYDSKILRERSTVDLLRVRSNVIRAGKLGPLFTTVFAAAVDGDSDPRRRAPVPPAPDEVREIVEETERRAKVADIETEQVGGFFHTDPYISLAYREDGVIKTACLMIWDGQTILHSATLA